jgi:hypothetical protein
LRSGHGERRSNSTISPFLGTLWSELKQSPGVDPIVLRRLHCEILSSDHRIRLCSVRLALFTPLHVPSTVSWNPTARNWVASVLLLGYIVKGDVQSLEGAFAFVCCTSEVPNVTQLTDLGPSQVRPNVWVGADPVVSGRG